MQSERDSAKYQHDTGHLSPTNFDLTLYMWSGPNPDVGRGHPMEPHWGIDAPNVRRFRFRASGSLKKRSQVFEVHLVIGLDDDKVPTQTWFSMGMLAKSLQMVLELDRGLTCKSIDRTVIDVDYIPLDS